MKNGFPSKHEFDEWLEHPVTKTFREALELERDRLRRQWESGAFGDYTEEATVLTNMTNVGYCRGLAEASEMSYVGLATRLDVPLTEEEAKDD